MTDENKRSILEIRDGRIVCPVCGKKTDQAVLSETSAESLVVFCKQCKSRMLVKIENGSASASA